MAIERQKYTETLPVQLTEPERLDRADLAARLMQERDSMEAAMKAEVSQRKADIQERDARMRSLQEEVRQRRAYKPVDCERQYDYAAGKVREVRLDTGAVLNERDMTHSEKQRHLGFDEDGKKGGGKPKRSPAAEAEMDAEGERMAPPAEEKDAAAAAAERVRGRRKKRTEAASEVSEEVL